MHMKTTLDINSIIADHPGEGTCLALRLLIENSLTMQKPEILGRSIKEAVALHGELNWLKSYCTVKLGTARRTGHTTAAIDVLKRFPNSQLISISEDQGFNSIQYFTKGEEREKTLKRYATINNFGEVFRYRGRPIPDVIVVDGAFMWSHSKLEELYKYIVDWCNLSNPFLLILIG